MVAFLGIASVLPAPGRAQAGPALVAQLGHTDDIISARFSPDGRQLLTAGGTVAKLWDLESGRQIREFGDGSASFTDAIFVPQTGLVATSAQNGKSQLWQASTGKNFAALQSSFSVWNLAASPNGKYLAVSGNDVIHLVDLASSRTLRELRVVNPGALAFAPDSGELFFSAYEVAVGRLGTQDPASGASLQVQGGAMSAMSIDESGRFIALANNFAFGVVDLRTRKFVWVRRLNDFSSRPPQVAISPDGAFMAIRRNNVVTLWPAQGAEAPIAERAIDDVPDKDHSNILPLPKLAFSPDGTRLAVAERGSVLILASPTLEMKSRIESLAAPISRVALDPSQQWLVVLDKLGRLTVLDVSLGHPVHRRSGVAHFKADVLRSVVYLLDRSGGVAELDLQSMKESALRPPTNGEITHFDVSRDGKLLALVDERNNLFIRDVATGYEKQIRSDVQVAAFSPDGRSIAIASSSRKLQICNLVGAEIATLAAGDEVLMELDIARGIGFSADGRHVGLVGGHAAVEWDTGTGRATSHSRPKDHALDYLLYTTSIAFIPDGRFLVGSRDSTAQVWAPGSEVADSVLEGHTGSVDTVASSSDGRLIVTGGEDGIVKVWTRENGRAVANVIVAATDRWLVTAGDGRFDVDDFDRQTVFSWRVPDDPLQALPPEIFMRDYFEPRLLPRLMAGEKFAELPGLDTLNRVQPRVKVISVDPERPVRGSASAEPQTVQVTVEVSGDSREFGLGDAKRRMATGAYDLRLFRDGQLVGQWPPEPVTTGARHVDREQELAQWRKDHPVVEYAESASAPKRITFEGIRLPRIAGKDKVEFSAYAFNVDRVKSETAKLLHDLPKGVTPRVPRAYIVTIGVNAFEDEVWDLKYAANDARQSGSELKKRLEAIRAPDGSKQYEKVVWVPLVSDADKTPGKARRITSTQANKKQIEAVLKTLAGQAVDHGALTGIDSANDLRRVNPEDLLIIVVSTHGLNEGGSFYFLPADIGAEFSPTRTPNPDVKAAMLARAVSNDELAQWLRGVDAVDQVMIIDACRSAASVQSAEFKPGPMGSRGLGQLAYDKGMRILAATQVEQDAVDGTDVTQMGLLVYALIAEGLRAGKADNAPADGRIMLSEWLNYANQRVPGVFQDIQDGTIKGTKGEVEHSPDPKLNAARRASLQQPSLFDFARGRDLTLGAPNP